MAILPTRVRGRRVLIGSGHGRSGRCRVCAARACFVLIRPVRQSNNLKQLGTLGTGNHFIEVCLDETDRLRMAGYVMGTGTPRGATAAAGA